VAAHIRVTPPTWFAVSSPGVSAVSVVTTCVNGGFAASAFVVR
jgi:hypothetical protein